MTRIHAGHAYTHNKFALCIGKLEDDDPSSCLLIYDETFEGLWGFVDVPRILLSVTSFPSETRDKTIYVTMSDEGDVYFIEGDVPVEKIPGAGVRSDDAEDLGPMNVVFPIPDTVVLDANNNVVEHFDKVVEKAELENAINRALGPAK